jgi:hypothetical protein
MQKANFYLNLKEIEIHSQQISNCTNEQDIANNEKFIGQATHFYEANFKEVEDLRMKFNEMKNKVTHLNFYA